MKHFARAINEEKMWWGDLGQLSVFPPNRSGGEKEKSESHGLRQRQGEYLFIYIYQLPLQSEQALWAAGT